MDAEVDEDVELLSTSSVVIESVRSRVDDDEAEDEGCCFPSVESVSGSGVVTERLASSLLMPLCAYET